MTWLVIIEFEKADDAALTLMGVTKVLKQTNHPYVRAGVRETGSFQEATA